MEWWLRTLSTLTEDPRSLPESPSPIAPVPEDPMSSALHGTCKHNVHTHTYTHMF